ncbi:glycoside hydrolase family 6 protein [Amantichitinum ursilacus]|uniref:Glucanase n=1 Tax=Amantichitinum ursilacus TaxID=857265 RepID=A0A0N0XJG1_9NEIS|nr:glycoside hydrolase family 6 protein [Amantichitinum ursilacus]KPC50730.1 Endoglucanase E-2 precursor [Amantichitinum ursilacus]
MWLKPCSTLLLLTLAGALHAAEPVRPDAASAFYVNPDSNAAQWLNAHRDDPRADAIRSAIASQPTALWFGGWSADVRGAVERYISAAAVRGQLPLLVAYNVPQRDCGQYSKGGAASASAYQTWIESFFDGIGPRAALVVLEPDALAQMDCLNAADKALRLQLLRHALDYARSHASASRVYLDAGHSGWLAPAEAARRLTAAGVAQARGFALNVSNYGTTAANTAYGKQVAAALQQQGIRAHFVIDTSRNGNGPLGSQWCDAPGRKLGTPATQYAGEDGLDAVLWIKPPGNADGCAAKAGTFDADLANKLINGD